MRFEAVWLHCAGAVWGGGEKGAAAREMARLVRAFEEGEEGVGEALVELEVEVEVRFEGDLVGEALRAGAGNSRGWWRVETMLVLWSVRFGTERGGGGTARLCSRRPAEGTDKGCLSRVLRPPELFGRCRW